MNKLKLILLFILISLVASACASLKQIQITSQINSTKVMPTYTPYPTYTINPTFTPIPTYTPLPTYTMSPVIPFLPAETEVIIIGEKITPTAIANVPFSPGNENEFKAYLLNTYNTIANNPLDIAEITILNYETAYSVFIELTNDSAVNVFENQTQKNALNYGTRLLEDAIIYFEGKDCFAFVDEILFSDDLEYYLSQDQTFYYVGDYDVDHDGWLIRKSYIIASLFEGKKQVDVWNYK